MHSKSFRRRLLGRETPSNSSSRAESCSRTPLAEDDSDYEEDTEADFNQLQDYLNSKLASLAQVVHDGPIANGQDRSDLKDRKHYDVVQLSKARVQSESTTFNEIIFSLGRPRTEVSTSSRELLLAQLYKIVVSKPLVVYNEEHAGTPAYVDEVSVQKLVEIFNSKNYRTELEFLYLFRALIATLLSDMDENSQFVTSEFLAYLQELIDAPATNVITNANKTHIMTGFAALVLVLQNGSSTFGVDDKIAWLMERAESLALSAIELKKNFQAGDREYSTLFDKNSDKTLVSEAWEKVTSEESLAIAALHAIATLLTLLEPGEFLNEIVEDLVLRVVPLVDNDEFRDLAKAAGRLVAVIYEIYDYSINETGEDEDDANVDEEYNANAPYYEQEALFSIFERLTNLSSKRFAKKEKREFHSVFRNILHTLRAYVDQKTREEIYKGSPEGREIQDEIMDSTYIKLSKYKALPINTWYLYMRLRTLKWVFSFGLHNQLIANEDIKDILKQKENDFQYTSNRVDPAEDLDESSHDFAEIMEKQHVLDDKTRTSKIKKLRAEKIHQQLEGLGLED